MSSTTPNWAPPERPVELRDYWFALRLRWYWIPVGALLGAALGIGAGLLAPSTYEASTSVLLQPLSTDLLSTLDGRNAIDMSTERQIATSRQVTVRTVEQLGDDGLTPEGLGANLRVVIAEDTRVLRFEYEAQDPETAAQRANAVVDTYLSLRQERGDQIVSRVRASAEQRAEQIGLSLGEAQRELEELRAEADALEEVPEALTSSIRDVEVQVGTLTAQQALAQADLFNLPPGGIDGGSVITAAVPPSEPSSLGVPLLAVLGVLLGSLAGGVLAFLLQAVDAVVRSGDDVVEALGTTALGFVADPSPRRRDRFDASGVEGSLHRIASAVDVLLGEQRPRVVVLLDAGGGVVDTIAPVMAAKLSRRQRTVVLTGTARLEEMDVPAFLQRIDPAPTAEADRPDWVRQTRPGVPDTVDLEQTTAPDTALEAVADLLPSYDVVVAAMPQVALSTSALNIAALPSSVVVPVVRLGEAEYDELRLLRRDLVASGATILGAIIVGQRSAWGSADLFSEVAVPRPTAVPAS